MRYRLSSGVELEYIDEGLAISFILPNGGVYTIAKRTWNRLSDREREALLISRVVNIFMQPEENKQ